MNGDDQIIEVKNKYLPELSFSSPESLMLQNNGCFNHPNSANKNHQNLNDSDASFTSILQDEELKTSISDSKQKNNTCQHEKHDQKPDFLTPSSSTCCCCDQEDNNNHDDEGKKLFVLSLEEEALLVTNNSNNLMSMNEDDDEDEQESNFHDLEDFPDHFNEDLKGNVPTMFVSACGRPWFVSKTNLINQQGKKDNVNQDSEISSESAEHLDDEKDKIIFYFNQEDFRKRFRKFYDQDEKNDFLNHHFFSSNNNSKNHCSKDRYTGFTSANGKMMFLRQKNLEEDSLDDNPVQQD